MIASVLVEYNVKSLDKVFDYLIPEFLLDTLKVGHKVLVPFGTAEIEGFVLEIKNELDKSLEYKEIKDIVESDFYLKEDLIELGRYMKNVTLSNLIACYQIMLPKGYKAKKGSFVNKKYETYIYLADSNIVDAYINKNPRRKKEIEIIESLKDKEVLKNSIKSSSLPNLIKNNIVIEKFVEVNRSVSYNIEEKNEVTLTFEQNDVYENIINSNENIPFLLYGVTGSGKTEVYIKLIRYYLNIGKTAILLVPEISLTPQIVSKFMSNFGSSVAVLHSRLSSGEKFDEYRRIMRGEVSVVVGARSAIFAPLDNIGIIIIDECQSPTYKQESTPKYNGIEIGIERAKMHNAVCLMGSATPSLEQYARAKKGVYHLLELNNRISLKLPKIKLVDMEEEVKKRNFIISSELKSEISECLRRHEQVILLLNRRGYSTFISCSACGYVHKCPNCDISMIYHKSTNNLVCHYCGYLKKMSNICPECHEDAIKDLGLGTEKLESIIKEMYASARVIRMDADTTTRKGSYEKIIDSFKNHEYDILIGTQMISKGLNFPDVSLVGVINTDASLSIPDFRSGERTFELLTQTAGRTGRYDKEGKVLIQTYNPDNYVLHYVLKGDYKSFYNYEMNIRKKLSYPPYYNIVLIKVVSSEYEISRDNAKKIKEYLDRVLNHEYIILGPSTARILKMNNKYTFQIIIKYKYGESLFNELKKLTDNYVSSKVTIDIDINPISFI